MSITEYEHIDEKDVVTYARDESGLLWKKTNGYWDRAEEPRCDHNITSVRSTILTQSWASEGARVICVVCRMTRYLNFAKDLSAIGLGDDQVVIPEDIRNDPTFGTRHGIQKDFYPEDRLAKVQKMLDEFNQTMRALAKIP